MVWLILLTLWAEYGESSSSYAPKWYIYFFGGLYALSPIIHFLKDTNSSEGFFKKTLRCYSRYIVSFLIGLGIFIVLFWLGSIFDEMLYLDFAEIVLALFMLFCVYGIGTWLVLSYAWDEVKPVDETSSRSIRKSAVWLAAFFFFLWLSPDWKEVIIDGRIDAAQSKLQKYGETAEGYKKAASVWGLKWAMQERYLENRLYEKGLYARIFDTSIESDIDDELDVNKFRTRTSNGTSMLARWENAKVELNFAKHESEIKSDIGAMETTVTYEFQNTDTQNQEVIYSIELPSSDSVVTDLRLGLNLELTGTLAPRGAAEQVYVDSLRRNTDPALLEQTGPTTYRLRVFPVLSVNDVRTQGRQRVQFKYITPISSGADITVMPKTDILNLKLTKKSEIVTRVMEGTKALVQDSFKTDDIEDLLSGKTVNIKLENPLKESLSYCAINTYEGFDMKSLPSSEKKITKNIVFLDISKSAGSDKKVKKRYQELIDTWKNNGAALDIYTFNTAVTSAGYDLSDIEFWGNTDMGLVISYIQNNNLENANIVILTDADSYERAGAEDKTIDYKKLKSNRISLVVLGDTIRTLKTEVTKSILASEGDVMRLAPKASLDEGIKTIFTPKQAPATCESYTGNNTGALSAIEGSRDGKKVVGESINGVQKTIVSTIYPVRLDEPNRYGISNKTSEYMRNPDNPDLSHPATTPIYDIQWNTRTLYYSYYTNGDANRDWLDMKVSKDGFYYLSWSSLIQTENGNPIHNYKETYTQLSNSTLLEKIGKKANIVNQSMSLIALENDQQRRDLERYSNQEDKYDTSYQNFDNTSNSPEWNRRWTTSDIRPWNFTMELSNLDAVTTASRSPSRWADSMFSLSSKSTSTMSINSSSADISITGGTTRLLSWGGGGGGGLLQIVAIIILFPVIAWYVLRKKKPKAENEVKKEEDKPV